MHGWKPIVAVVALAVAGSGCTTIVRSSVASNGAAANAETNPLTPRAISDDGRYIVFVSAATNLVPNDTNGTADVFRHDNQTGATVRVSVTTAGEQNPSSSGNAVISGDGDHVAFVTAQSLEPADSNNKDDVYVRTISTGTTERVSIRPDGSPVIGETTFGAFGDLSLSHDGRFVAMLNVGAGFGEIFVRDRTTHTTTFPNHGLAASKVVISSDGTQIVWNVACTGGPCPGLSVVQPVGGTTRETIDSQCGFTALDVGKDAGFVVGSRFGVYPMFQCPGATGLVRWDRTTKTFVKVPVDAYFESGVSMSDNGRFVAALGQDNVLRVADMDTAIVSAVDGDTSGARGSEPTTSAALSGSGRYIAFTSAARLVPDDTNGFTDVYTRYAIHPVASSVAPATLARGVSGATVMVTGTELLSGVKAAIAGTGVTINSVHRESTTSIKLDVSVKPNAAPGARDVIVSNTGGFGQSDNVCSGCLSVG